MMRAADLGVLSIQQTGKCPPLLCEKADVVIRDIKEIIWVIEKEKSHLKKGGLS